MPANSKPIHHDRTWKSTQAISFADAKANVWRLPISTVRDQESFHKQDFVDRTSECDLPAARNMSELLPDLGRGKRSTQNLGDIVAWRPQVDVKTDVLRMAEETRHGRAELATTIFEDRYESSLARTPEGSQNGSKSSVPTDVSPSYNLRLQSSPRLLSPELSASTYPTEGEFLYPAMNNLPLASKNDDYGSSEKIHTISGGTLDSSSPSENPPFCTPLGFHIPRAKLQRAIDAAPSSTGSYWQYTLYQGPGGEKDKVKVHYCKSKDSTERVAQLFLEEEVIGFDIEWKMNAMATDGVKNNVALIQIANEKRIALFHIARYSNATSVDDFVAPTLRNIMESPSITKVGVSVKGDCTRLRKFMNIDSRGIFELSHLYKLVKFSCGDVKKINKVMVSLARQVEEHLQLPLWKGEVRSSDWSQDLNYQQIQCKPPLTPVI